MELVLLVLLVPLVGVEYLDLLDLLELLVLAASLVPLDHQASQVLLATLALRVCIQTFQKCKYYRNGNFLDKAYKM